jgi:hypothetical protein
MESSSLIILAAEEQVQLERSRALLRDSIELLSEVEQLYDLLPESHTFQAPLSHEDGVRLYMLLVCRRHLTVGMLTMLRGYHADSQRHLREAIECLAFAICISDQPALGRLWADATKGGAEWKAYRKAFGRAVEAAKSRLKELYAVHDECSKASHPSIQTVGRYMRTGNRLTELPIQWADMMNERLLLLVFFNDLLSYFRIVEAFALLFRDAAKPDSEWDTRTAVFLGKLAIHQDRTSRQIAAMKEADHWIR